MQLVADLYGYEAEWETFYTWDQEILSDHDIKCILHLKPSAGRFFAHRRMLVLVRVE